jgi:hypothetical protein
VVYSQDKKYNLQKKSLIKFAKNLAKMILMHKKLISPPGRLVIKFSLREFWLIMIVVWISKKLNDDDGYEPP